MLEEVDKVLYSLSEFGSGTYIFWCLTPLEKKGVSGKVRLPLLRTRVPPFNAKSINISIVV